MAEYYKGRRISTPEEEGLQPLTDEEKAATLAMMAEWNARRNAVPEDQRIHLSGRFGDDWHDDEVPRNPDGTRKDPATDPEQEPR
ncbi:hypothetical protein ABZ942_32425 [Nocardia sp. NPDC046473]|uniref:hypothetical protein n=1 Tax=Nocardia sp. NPDC046473 TaxID=3155733 RepID=UPI0033D8E4F0